MSLISVSGDDGLRLAVARALELAIDLDRGPCGNAPQAADATSASNLEESHEVCHF